MANTLVVARNPDDGTATYTHIRFQSAPDSSGVAGAFVNLNLKAIDSTNEQTYYEDTGGTTTDWYRYRYSNLGETVFSNWSANTQAGQHIVTQWLKSDIPDTDITDPDWVRWRDEVLADFQTNAIMREITSPISFTPASDTDEWATLTGEMRFVVRVDLHDSTGVYLTSTHDWYKWGRKVRILRPDTTKTYKIYGVGNIRHLGDLDDDYFTTLYWGIRLRYIDRRIADRINFKYFLNADKTSDVTLPQLQQASAQAGAKYQERLGLHKSAWTIPASHG